MGQVRGEGKGPLSGGEGLPQPDLGAAPACRWRRRAGWRRWRSVYPTTPSPSRCCRPSAAASANRFGSVSPTTADHARAELGDGVDFVLDGGPCQVGVESTIVDVTGEAPAILRPGGVTHEDLEAVLGSPVAVPSTGRVRVPGQHPSHYAPRARVVLLEPEKVVVEAELAQELGHQVGVFLPPSSAGASVKAHAVVAVPDAMAAYAHGLYGFLLELDQPGCDLIVASLPVEEGLGLTIANRLRRAAGPRPSA